MRVEEIIARLGGIPCWLFKDVDVPVLHRYASALEPGDVCVEVGTGYGCSATVLALSSSPEVRIVTIDDGRTYVGLGRTTKERYEKRVRSILKDRVPDRVEFICEDANKVEWDERINLLFIDGDHPFENVKADFLKWGPFVAVDGHVLFHDYGVLHSIRDCVNQVVIPQGCWTMVEVAPKICVLRRHSH